MEKALRATLPRTGRGDGVLGEEYGAQRRPPAGPSQRQWVIDPIDGTKNFVRGVPIWATLIALHGRRPSRWSGLVSAPGAGPALVGARRAPARTPGRHTAAGDADPGLRGEPARRRRFCYSSLTGWEQAGRLDAMLEITRRVWRSRAYGDFYGYMLLAEGAVDVMVEPELSLWDMAALVPIVTEAGGTFTDLRRPAPGPGRRQRGGHQRQAARRDPRPAECLDRPDPAAGSSARRAPVPSILARWCPPVGASSRR